MSKSVVHPPPANSSLDYRKSHDERGDEYHRYRSGYFDVEEPVPGSYLRRKFDSATTVKVYPDDSRQGKSNPAFHNDHHSRPAGEFELRFIGGNYQLDLVSDQAFIFGIFFKCIRSSSNFDPFFLSTCSF